MPRPAARVLLLATLIAAPACVSAARDRPARPAPDWQRIARPDDRARLRLWRQAWTEGLRQARAGGAEASIAAAGALLDPDAALADPALPDGLYRCATYRLGEQSGGDRSFVAGGAQPCRVAAGRLAVLAGTQRPAGRLWSYDPARLVFLGTMALSDEPRPLDYGRDAQRDMIGFVERVGDARWRLVLPRPRWQSQIDVIEIVPAGK